MPPDSNEYRTVARNIDLTTVRLSDCGWQDAVQQYGELEEEMVRLFQAEADIQEVRRRISEAIVSNISVADPAPGESAYEPIWQKLVSLGFSSDERKMSMHFFRLSYLMSNSNDLNRIRSELAAFRDGAERLLKRPDPGMGEHFAAVAALLEHRLAQRRGAV
ncbi:hypothetical protein EEB15_02200 [Ramlibacter sp. WS9]|nr:hypothetical protein EEB15_02200 [Ramlibacter sp. WS9]